MFKRPLIPVAALLWGLQASFLSPALALILVSLYHATVAEVGWVLAIYNAGGFVASLLIPAYADRRRNYLGPSLAAAGFTLALAVALWVATSLPVVTIALVVLGGPAGVGNSMLFAHLRHSGAAPRDVVNTRAVFSFAWVAGPPIATAVMGWFGNAAILVAIGIVAVVNGVTTLIMLRRSRLPSAQGTDDVPVRAEDDGALPKGRVAVILVAFVLAQATNAAAVAIMSLFVTTSLGLPVTWAGLALGLSAGLEIPALMLLGRLSTRYSSLSLLIAGCASGVAYYTGMVFVTHPAVLLALQVLNATFFAAIAGIGLTLFQEIIPRPGLATGLNANARRVGAILTGPIVAIAAGPWGYPGLFAACAVLTALAAAAAWLAGRRPAPSASLPEAALAPDNPVAGGPFGSEPPTDPEHPAPPRAGER